MSLDRRARLDDDWIPTDPAAFFGSELPEALEAHAEILMPGVRFVDPRPLTIELEGGSWTLSATEDSVAVSPLPQEKAARVRLDLEQLDNLVRDQATPMAFFTSGTLDMPEGGLGDFLDWWLVLRGALDGSPIYTPGDLTPGALTPGDLTPGGLEFRDRDGSPLDLGRAFTAEDSDEDMAHFLGEAGFIHIRGLFSEVEMQRISDEMDAAAPRFSDGDRHSWWVTVADGSRRLVRMQQFDRHSPATAALLEDDRFLRIGRISGDGHVQGTMPDNRIEALLKPIGVTQGISDVPWHKDCSLGRHSYDCCHLTVGISVTGAGEESGQLRVIAGSNRVLVWPALRQRGLDLPDLPLPTGTGDVTVHCSCTLHMAQPPVSRERRVLYTSFSLPDRTEKAELARSRLTDARESAPVTVTQEPGLTGPVASAESGP